MALFLSHSFYSVRRAARYALSAMLIAAALGGRADAIVYSGTPDLPLTVAMVAAGGGPAHFSSVRLFSELTGPQREAETAKLTKQFGAADVTNAFAIFDFAVADVIHIVRQRQIDLPQPSKLNSDALGAALYRAGTTTNGDWDVGYMLEHLMTHPIHHEIMHDMDARFGTERAASFHIILAQMMDDLEVAKGMKR